MILQLQTLQCQVIENLIYNPSFEEYHNSLPSHWSIINATPDLFKRNVWFYPGLTLYKKYMPNAFDGNSMFGFVTSEIIQGKFNNKLKPGNTYRLNFYVNSIIPNIHAVAKIITINISDSTAPSDINSSFYANPIVINDIDTFQIKKNEWQKVSIDYVAKGNEQYFQIGLFGQNISKKNNCK